MKPWQVAAGFSGIGFYIAGCIILGILGGRWLDDKLSTDPLWFIIGLVLGFATAALGVYSMLRPLLKNGGKGEDSK